MHLVGIACVRNEEDIIEPFVRHNLALLDHLIIADHRSTDRTPEILRQLIAEGLPLTVTHDHSLGNDHGGRVTRLMQQAASLPGTTWIFPLDADEFLDFGDGFHGELASAAGPILKLPLRHYLMHPEDSSAEANPVLRLGHRLAFEHKEDCPPAERSFVCFKVAVSAAAARRPHARLSQGNHRFEVAGSEIPAHFPAHARIGHFSIRSPGQYAAKLALWTLENLTNPSLHAQAEDFYLPDYERMKRSFSGFQERGSTGLPAWLPVPTAADGASSPAPLKDPFPYRGGPLRHPALADGADRLIHQLLGHAEELARNVHKLSLETSGESGSQTHFGIEGSDELRITPSHSVQRLELGFAPPAENLRLNITGPPALLKIQQMAWMLPGGACLPPAKTVGTTKLIMHGGLDVSEDGPWEIAKQSGTLALNLAPLGAPPPESIGLRMDVVLSDSLAEIGKRLLTPPIPERLQRAYRAHGYASRELEKMRTWKGFLRHRIRMWVRSLRTPQTPSQGTKRPRRD